MTGSLMCVCITGFLMSLHLPFLKSQSTFQQWAGASRTPLSLLAGQFMLVEAMAHSALLFGALAELPVQTHEPH